MSRQLLPHGQWVSYHGAMNGQCYNRRNAQTIQEQSMTIDKFEDAPYRNHEPEFTDIEGSVK